MRRLLIGALACTVVAAALAPDAYADGARRARRVHAPAGAVLYPGWGYYSFPWGYVLPDAPYAYPVVTSCLRRYPVPRPWGVGWRETWVC